MSNGNTPDAGHLYSSKNMTSLVSFVLHYCQIAACMTGMQQINVRMLQGCTPQQELSQQDISTACL
jgi:hypothetical protein